MTYYIDLHDITLNEYQSILQTADLLPSRRILQENKGAVFGVFIAQGLRTLANLQDDLKTKQKLTLFVQASGLDKIIKKVLIWEVSSLPPKSNKLADFPCTLAEVVEKLAELGIKHTLQLYDRILAGEDRATLAMEIGVEKEVILRLA